MTTWMVVEDESDIYELMLTMFKIWGVTGVAFADAEQAIDWIDAVDRGEITGELPELALIDIRLPEAFEGYVVGARLRASEKLGDIPIAMMTAYKLNPTEEQEMYEETAADALIYKPLPKFNELKRLLESVVVEGNNRRAGGSAKKGAAKKSDAISEDEAQKQESRKKRDNLLAAVISPLLAKRAAERSDKDKNDK